MNTIALPGCTPTPLASYLKALGILRVLSRQFPEARVKGYWRDNAFVLVAACDADALVEFFLRRYEPAPIIAPWNGGSGFYPKDKATGKALAAIRTSPAKRFAHFQTAIRVCSEAIQELGLKEKPESKEVKRTLQLLCRNRVPDEALSWIDCAYILTESDVDYPPLVGTGGNDGRLEFTGNYMQRLGDVFDLGAAEAPPTADSSSWLHNSLWGTPTNHLVSSLIGQFSPAANGGTNSSTAFDENSTVNPWDFILCLEGALVFAGAATRRLESLTSDQLAYPFCVTTSGTGYGSCAPSDTANSRCEIWMPLWTSQIGLTELERLCAEGRAIVHNRPASSGVDFALAITALGVDRGITEFQRYGFLKRNGDCHYASPLQRLRVHRDPVTTDLLASCDAWVQRFLRKAKSDTAPGSVRRAAGRLEAAIFARAAASQADNPETALELLIALGECERALAASLKWTLHKDIQLRPIPPLPRSWISRTKDYSIEYRLAAALASLSPCFKGVFFPLRRHLEPVKVVTGEKSWSNWDDDARNEVVWHDGSIIDVLCALMKRRLLLAKSSGEEGWPEYARLTAWPSDIAAFIEGRIDETRFGQLLWGLSLVNFSGDAFTGDEMPVRPDAGHLDDTPSAFYAQLKLCFAGRLPEDKKVPVEPIIFHLAEKGDGDRASTQALRRLHGSSIPITHIHIPLAGEAARRTAAALIFPLWDSQLAKVCQSIAPDFFNQPSTR